MKFAIAFLWTLYLLMVVILIRSAIDDGRVVTWALAIVCTLVGGLKLTVIHLTYLEQKERKP